MRNQLCQHSGRLPAAESARAQPKPRALHPPLLLMVQTVPEEGSDPRGQAAPPPPPLDLACRLAAVPARIQGSLRSRPREHLVHLRSGQRVRNQLCRHSGRLPAADSTRAGLADPRALVLCPLPGRLSAEPRALVLQLPLMLPVAEGSQLCPHTTHHSHSDRLSVRPRERVLPPLLVLPVKKGLARRQLQHRLLIPTRGLLGFCSQWDLHFKVPLLTGPYLRTQ